MKLQAVIDAMNAFAPPHLAEPWDRIGLQVGRADTEIQAVLVTLDVTAGVIDEVSRAGARLIVAHHPLIFHSLERITDATPTQQAVRELIRRDIALFVAHTNLDAAPGGVADTLAESIGLRDTRPLLPAATNELKIVAFVPPGALERVSWAMCQAGAGRIGQYSDCTFRVAGTGSFTASDSARPAIGKPGEHHEVDEFRLEAVAPAEQLGAVLAAIRSAHPYETPAIDVYPLAGGDPSAGAGRIGSLAQPLTLAALAAQVKAALDAMTIQLAGDLDRACGLVAVCPGSGGSCLRAAIDAGCHAFVTGEMGYHDAQEAAESGMALIAAGHYATERPIVPKLCELLAARLPGAKLVASTTITDPWHRPPG